jgi:hypothetical protein
MPSVYISPKTDFAFKKIFGSKESKDICNAILKAEQEGRQKERLEIARQLLDVLDVETISQKTGLTVTEIQSLRSHDS